MSLQPTHSHPVRCAHTCSPALGPPSRYQARSRSAATSARSLMLTPTSFFSSSCSRQRGLTAALLTNSTLIQTALHSCPPHPLVYSLLSPSTLLGLAAPWTKDPPTINLAVSTSRHRTSLASYSTTSSLPSLDPLCCIWLYNACSRTTTFPFSHGLCIQLT